jgi:hypothetical protein
MRPPVFFPRRSCSAALLALACQAATPSLTARGEGPARSDAPVGCRSQPDEPRSSLLPSRAATFCVDPYALVHAYDLSDPEQSAQACERVLGAGCMETAAGRPERVVAGRYLDELAPGGADVIVQHFADPSLAFIAFTEQLLEGTDPAELGVQPFDAPGVAVRDATAASAWRGSELLWLRYTSSELPPAAELARASEGLPDLVRALAASFPAEPGLPAAVERLPERQRIPLGVRLLDSDAVGVPGLGRVALGHYQDGSKRWRVLASVRPDWDSAKDVLSTLRKQPGVRKIKGLDAVEVRVRRAPSEPEVEWLIAQRGEVVYGIGDEPVALPEHMSARAEASVKLSRHEKLLTFTRVHHR